MLPTRETEEEENKKKNWQVQRFIGIIIQKIVKVHEFSPIGKLRWWEKSYYKDIDHMINSILFNINEKRILELKKSFHFLIWISFSFF